MINNLNHEIGQRVRFYRTTRKMSMMDLVKKLPRQLTAQQLSKYEIGHARWPADLLCEIAAALAVDIKFLICAAADITPKKDDCEWEAEKYKCLLLETQPARREMAYRILDLIFGRG